MLTLGSWHKLMFPELAANPANAQHPAMEIRDARPEDAQAGSQLLRRSIVELCVADHRNDPAVLARWLSNKTPEAFVSWLVQPGNSVLVAVEDGNLLAVGSVTDAGKITLNYVSPDARFRGVTRALLRALEMRAAERGNERCVLTSTETARCFYHASGYVESGPPVGEFGTMAGYPMEKWLQITTG
jgi:GNAT superfamily N-acetyltransferase